MSTSQGLGRLRPPLFGGWAPWSNLFSLDQDIRVVAEEFYWGGYPPPPVQIPWTWFRAPVRTKQDNPLNVAEVSMSGGATARSRSLTSISASNGREWKFAASLDSVVTVDPANLAQWITTFYADPRSRHARLQLVLNVRTVPEIWRILGVTQGRRITITGVPAGLPDGAAEMVVEGIFRSMPADLQVVEWITTPLVGAAVGESGPWFRTDDSRTNDSSGTDVVPF